MESEPRVPGKGKRKLYRIGRKKTFFDRKSKLLKMSYHDLSIYLTLLLFIVLGLFRNVIWDFVASLW